MCANVLTAVTVEAYISTVCRRGSLVAFLFFCFLGVSGFCVIFGVHFLLVSGCRTFGCQYP